MSNVEDMIDVRRVRWEPRTAETVRRVKFKAPETRTAIELHHGGIALDGRNPVDAWRSYSRYHRLIKEWADIWYGLGIHPDGRLYELRGAYAANSSRPWLTVNLPGHGDFDTTEAQFETLQKLQIAFYEDTGSDVLRFHAQRGGTICPGGLVIDRIKELQSQPLNTKLEFPLSPIDQVINPYPDAQGPLVGPITVPGYDGYYIIGADGGVFTPGGIPFYGSLPGKVPQHDWRTDPIVGFSPYVVLGQIMGYYLMSSMGAVFAFGNAQWHGRVERV